MAPAGCPSAPLRSAPPGCGGQRVPGWPLPPPGRCPRPAGAVFLGPSGRFREVGPRKGWQGGGGGGTQPPLASFTSREREWKSSSPALALPGGCVHFWVGGSSASPASCSEVAEPRVAAGVGLLELSGRCRLPAVGWDRGAPGELPRGDRTGGRPRDAPSSGTAAGPGSDCPEQAAAGGRVRPVPSRSSPEWVARILCNCIYGGKAVCASRPAASRLAAQGIRKVVSSKGAVVLTRIKCLRFDMK